jgi:hypothetical protein
MKTEKKLVIALMFFAMTLTGIILNSYNLLSENALIDTAGFNKILLKSSVISLIVSIVIVFTNYKKFKN